MKAGGKKAGGRKTEKMRTDKMGTERMKTGRLAELAMLTAAALIIFVVELQIPNPFPVPGVKLGLATSAWSPSGRADTNPRVKVVFPPPRSAKR